MFEQVLSLLSNPPSSLVYHFLVFFSVEAALAMAMGQWMREREPATARLTVALLVIGLARAVLAAIALLSWQNIIAPNLILPPIERSVDSLTALALMWGFVTMDDPVILRRNTFADILSGIALVLVLGASAFSAMLWFRVAAPGVIYNGLLQDFSWGVAQISMLSLGLLWMLFRIRYVYDSFLKAAILLIFGAGASLHLFQPPLSDIAAATRLGLAIAMPALAAVTYRHVVQKLLTYDVFHSTANQPLPMPGAVAEAIMALPSTPGQELVADLSPAPPDALPPDLADLSVPEPPDLEGEGAEQVPMPVQIGGRKPAVAQRAVPMDDETGPDLAAMPALPPELLREYPDAVHVVEAISGLVESLDIEQAGNKIARAVASALRADVAAIISLDEENHRGDILAAYDNIAQSYIEGGTLALEEQPTIVNALGRLRQMRLTPQRNMRELRNLFKVLQITHTGPVYVQPLHADKHRLGVLVVGSPYAKVPLSNAERTLLDRFGTLVTKALLNATAMYDAVQKKDEASVQAHQQAEAALARADVLEAELQEARKRSEEIRAYVEDLEQQVEQARQSTQVRDSARLAELERELEQTRNSSQIELSALRMRLTTATVTQQEAAMLQEQLMAKAREVIALQTRLDEAQVKAEAVRAQLRDNATDQTELERYQKELGQQKREIERLKDELAEAQAQAGLAFEARQQLAAFEAKDRQAMTDLEVKLVERRALVEALEAQLAEKSKALVVLQANVGGVDDSLRVLEGRLRSKTDEVGALQAELERIRKQADERINSLQQQLLSQPAGGAGVDQTVVDQLQAELAEKADAIRRLEAQLAEGNRAVSSLEAQLAATTAAVETAISEAQQVDSHDEVIASVAQELRTPMSSIMGYTDLLLGESVGIIGALQRKFLQRVKANTERMASLLDNLVSITALDSGQLRLEQQKVNVSAVVEEAITSTVSQFQEKNVTLRLQVDEPLPGITADHDAIQQVISHLLTNASLATPVDGEVLLRAGRAVGTLPGPDGEEYETECVHFAVTDAGPGIKPEDQERVFLRKYRADNPLIEGLGDTGVALSIAKTLVDTHGGRIWLESGPNVGSTFHVLLPVERVRADAGQFG